MKQDLTETLDLGESTTARLEGKLLLIKGPSGQVSRSFVHPKVAIKVEGTKVVLEAKKATKREKRAMSTFAAHIKNLIKGVKEPYLYKLKICSGHFPIQVSISGKEFVIKNFLGETVPRKFTLPLGAEVKVAGTEITVKSEDKELAGQIAARIETLCRITKRDLRIFQDGCYIVHKAGKDLA